MPGEATVDIRAAARASGLSVKAIRRRVERGSLPAIMVDGRRRIPVSALLRAGLLVDQADRAPRSVPQPPLEHEGALVARIDRQSEEISRLADEVARLAAEVRRLQAAAG